MAGTFITVQGPVFDGQAEAGLISIGEQIRSAVADMALKDLSSAFAGSFMHPTGRYEATVVKDMSSATTTEVTDQGAVRYGAWLEGTSRRNASTRFKGYHSFRKVTQGLNRGRAAATATQILAYNMGRLGG